MKRSLFSLSHTKLFSCDMGELVPIGLVEVLPGDTFQHKTSMLLRCSPLLAPVMHPVDVRIHHWFVPHRIVWEDWEDFITGGPDGMDASVFPTITFPASQPNIGDLGDYLGVPTDVGVGVEVSALPFRAYAMIWNHWYRDKDLQAELVVDQGSGPDTTTSTVLQSCAWEKDYFTSARPWEQKGPSITIPIGTSAPITGIGAVVTEASAPNALQLKYGAGSTQTPARVFTVAQDIRIRSTNTGVAANDAPDIVADLSNASAVSVTALREALALQRFEEARARFGSDYVEYLRYLGVKSSDARLQLPEYLGGGRQRITFSEVLQTAEGTDPVGEMKGHGISALQSNRYRAFFEEHGYVITVMSVRPKTMYIQGLPRTWNRRFKEDFFQKELQHIGQQQILNKEIDAAHASPNDTWGFQDRYDEYRRQESWVSGEFRSSLLNFWHLAREFNTPPALNADFVKCVPSERIFAVPSQDVLWCQAKHNIAARRLVSGSSQSFIF